MYNNSFSYNIYKQVKVKLIKAEHEIIPDLLNKSYLA